MTDDDLNAIRQRLESRKGDRYDGALEDIAALLAEVGSLKSALAELKYEEMIGPLKAENRRLLAEVERLRALAPFVLACAPSDCCGCGSAGRCEDAAAMIERGESIEGFDPF